ncbi:MAG: glycosyltransferase family 2 protein [Roseofilum sp. SBFL]|uniref:glycosyltransferase family 2 protein n=1 Tax=unclassified Roseofilum TaxID=2620099 RepID=UPI001B2DF610|nr:MULTISPECIES: glycosyltransferase family 2 protein [unclassified Roseofilum]MBP0013594.1 glycosyltransferase family 2 protein [Roseofilum sp. SID3]MBP0025263.1 glycosyltransferase family 2 protein [Roseofilum sp. SID2]MBP0037779.1 glycosyltransferase family 2 protein [Roseofilum sp. SID1]MBP0041350.1 glycosyltransferase family 2 protein [Roseofilum sp. SBFL]
MNSSHPKISVCIPTFNRVQLLTYAIESVLAQTEMDWELIVCDDGSQDKTPQIMAGYQQQDDRISYIRHDQNIGKSNNMRSGFYAAKGDFFVKFDDDDRLGKDFLAATSKILIDHPEIDFVGTDHWIIDLDNQRNLEQTEINSRRWGRTELLEGQVNNLLETVFVQQSFQVGATLFQTQVLKEVDFMRPHLQNCEDNDLFVRIALAGKKGYYLPQRLMEYRFHPEQQGIDRAIPYLRDKLNYLSSYQFEDRKLETIRQQRLQETQLLLGLRLVEKNQVTEGRELIQKGRSFSPKKAWIGLGLSRLPQPMREKAFEVLRQFRS